MIRRLVRFAVTIVALGIPSLPAAPEGNTEAHWLRLRNEFLESRLELASSGQFYLILDPWSGHLGLYLEGTELRRFDLATVEVGAPRIAFVPSELPRGWWRGVRDSATLDPRRTRDRLRIQVPKGGAVDGAPEIPVPPPPEEAIRVPRRFRVHFEGGLSLIVDPAAPAGRHTGIIDYLSEAFDSVRFWSRDRVRVRVVLTRADADALFRSLPPGSAFLVAPPPPPGVRRDGD